MILTVTLNPSVDISYKLEKFDIDASNRVKDVSKTAGGKGLNVSRVLQQLDQKVGATGFLGGSLGAFIREELKVNGIKDYFVDCDGATRNCIAVIHDGGHQTEILEGGPEIKSSEAQDFMEKFRSAVKESEIVTMSGSLPQGLDKDFYNKLLTIASENDTPVLLDTGGALLEKALHHEDKPFLIKPNETEIADLLGKELTTDDDVVEALKDSLFAGVEWVVVTLGAEGAIIKHGKNIYRASIPKVEAVNPVGSGDSVIAGFADGLSKKLEPHQLIKHGLSMGVLNAMEEKTGHIDPDKVEWCKEQVQIEKR